jgi:hypothetical protein
VNFTALIAIPSIELSSWATKLVPPSPNMTCEYISRQCPEAEKLLPQVKAILDRKSVNLYWLFPHRKYQSYTDFLNVEYYTL